MRNKMVAILILLIGLSLLAIGLIHGQHLNLISLYEQMIAIP